MVSKIHVSALKSIKNLEIECSGLNLLVGRNSSGKSTFLQALLLYAQRKLDGKYISVGGSVGVNSAYLGRLAIIICQMKK